MKTIIETKTGRVICVTPIEIELQKGQNYIDEIPTTYFLKPYFNGQFYEGATPEEIAESQKEIEVNLNDRIAQLENEIIEIKAML